MTRIFVFGDSHTHALKQALTSSSAQDAGTPITVHWRLKEKNGVIRGNLKFDEAKGIISTLTTEDILALSFLGTYHNVIGLLAHERKFFVTDDYTELPCDTLDQDVIPYNVMKEVFYNQAKQDKKIPELVRHCKARIYHLAPPPPKEDNDYIISKTSEYRDRVIYNYDVNPPNLRLALWNLEMSAIQQLCADYNIKQISPPGECLTKSGFLKSGFYANDATHANKNYGELVLRQLIALREGIADRSA